MTGDVVFYEHWTQRFSKLDTGDVVVAASPLDPSKLVCKRIIGLPGDKVCIDPISVHRQYITLWPNPKWIGNGMEEIVEFG
ncbi:IMP1 inner mitochondrial membrane peptidase-like [Mortierella claussenii]|nr:IMP1 inner mitochondrial membrane peptidase-like [Mortierella claussenii]